MPEDEAGTKKRDLQTRMVILRILFNAQCFLFDCLGWFVGL